MIRPECAILPWDSEFFGVRIGRVLSPILTPSDVTAALQWAEAHAVVCLYALVDKDDTGSRTSLEACAFRAVDERLTLRRPVGAPLKAGPESSVRLATSEDARAVAAIARVSHRNTRFYTDGLFDRDKCDELYATWIVQALSERDAIVMVSLRQDTITGYIVRTRTRRPRLSCWTHCRECRGTRPRCSVER